MRVFKFDARSKILPIAKVFSTNLFAANVTVPYKNKLYKAFSEYSTNYNPKNFTKVDNFIYRDEDEFTSIY